MVQEVHGVPGGAASGYSCCGVVQELNAFGGLGAMRAESGLGRFNVTRGKTSDKFENE